MVSGQQLALLPRQRHLAVVALQHRDAEPSGGPRLVARRVGDRGDDDQRDGAACGQCEWTTLLGAGGDDCIDDEAGERDAHEADEPYTTEAGDGARRADVVESDSDV